MAAIMKVWRQIEHPTARVSMRIYLKNISDKFHPEPIWNDGALGFLKRSRRPNKKNKMSSDRHRPNDVKRT